MKIPHVPKHMKQLQRYISNDEYKHSQMKKEYENSLRNSIVIII